MHFFVVSLSGITPSDLDMPSLSVTLSSHRVLRRIPFEKRADCLVKYLQFLLRPLIYLLYLQCRPKYQKCPFFHRIEISFFTDDFLKLIECRPFRVRYLCSALPETCSDSPETQWLSFVNLAAYAVAHKSQICLCRVRISWRI